MIRKFYDAGAGEGGGTSPEVKAVADEIKNFKAKQEAAIEEVKKLATETKASFVTLDESVKANQKFIDESVIFMKEQREHRANESTKSFSSVLEEKLTEAKTKENFAQMKSNPKIGANFDIKAFDTKAAGTMTTGNYTGGTIGLSTWDAEFVRTVRRQPYIRQIVRNRPVSGMYVAWAEAANPDGGASTTAEGTAKSQADFDLVEANKKVEKITAYTKVSKEALDDIAFLQSEINTELLELINLKLDDQIYQGNGTTPNLKGITATGYAATFSVVGATGLVTGVDSANNFDAIRAAAWQIEAANFIPNYVVINPLDAAVMDVTKSGATFPQYVMPPFYSANGQVIHGMRIIVNNGVTAGNFLVGDFTKSNLGIREDINISIGYDGNDFTNNLLTILAEVRAVHYIKTQHVNAFVKGAFATAKTALETP